MSFSDIGNDVLKLILSQLDYKSYKKLQQVNKEINKILTNSRFRDIVHSKYITYIKIRANSRFGMLGPK